MCVCVYVCMFVCVCVCVCVCVYGCVFVGEKAARQVFARTAPLLLQKPLPLWEYNPV